ncbi:TetR/AcrR family transcriptional regulator [Siphonobacter sp. BAB-5405]|uniref:TetR/AcrR family transcriptional regulator n=1 Tax=Siphonobacter sp. BAB-5405 TaxID=1864825 RepID=UPI001E318E3C|nr:TetR/AcrR family transcriptional regulator [Siphonobacter sp. BAB-5405]
MFVKHTNWYFMSKAATTRFMILQKAFELMYRKGYQATSIDDILATTQVTKGAFYYHFKNKDEMGLAVIAEVMVPAMQQAMIEALRNSTDPVDDLYTVMHHMLLKDPFFIIEYGCPAVNFIDEMAALNPVFQQALAGLVQQWDLAIQESLRQGQNRQIIRDEVNPAQVASFILTGYSGVRNLGKVLGRSCYVMYLKELKNYLQALR